MSPGPKLFQRLKRTSSKQWNSRPTGIQKLHQQRATLFQNRNVLKLTCWQGTVWPGKTEWRSVQTVGQTNGGELNKRDGFSKDENMEPLSKKPRSDTDSLKLSSMVKCNSPARYNIRSLLQKPFCEFPRKQLKANQMKWGNILDEVDACDPIRVAVSVESAFFGNLGPSTGPQKHKYRYMIFNLRDNSNKDFRRRVLLGHAKPQEIVTMPRPSCERGADNQK